MIEFGNRTELKERIAELESIALDYSQQIHDRDTTIKDLLEALEDLARGQLQVPDSQREVWDEVCVRQRSRCKPPDAWQVP